MNYEATHQSVRDGSPAMWVSMTHDTITLVNEDGFEWTDPRDQWVWLPTPVPDFIDEDVEEISRLIDGDPWHDGGYLRGSGEHINDDSYIDYLNGN